MNPSRHILPAHSRRDFLRRAGCGFGGLALSYLLSHDSIASEPAVIDPFAPKKPHHTPKAKSIIWLFMEGGPSHLDLFDPKPMLEELAGQPMPGVFLVSDQMPIGQAIDEILLAVDCLPPEECKDFVRFFPL